MCIAGGALQKNKTLKELCLAGNELNHNDAFHIGSVLKNNFHLQLLDISNNDIQDEGFRSIADAISYQSVRVNKALSSGDSFSSSKFDFSDLTANLNNINNNRNSRFCPTPPPIIHVADDDGGGSINNNSILQCDNDEKMSKGANEGSDVAIAATGDMISTNDSAKSESGSSKDKFKYSTASLSPISHAYDDNTTNHQLFNARSPERSFSSESLCSETSIESNDSKSSIRLIETKFNNKNGTLERSSHTPQTPCLGEKPPTGLQVLILWNNSLSSKCGPSAAEMIESTEYLQIINLGQNPIGNEFLMEVKSVIKLNKSFSSLGLQATQLSDDGVKILADTLQFGGNSTLQRIDLRNNAWTSVGLSALSEALKSNKSIIRIDLDDIVGNTKYDNDLECQRWITAIRQQCAHNENPPEHHETAKATTTVQRIKRNHLSTRKISLTCASTKVTPSQVVEPVKKKASNRLSSPVSSPLPSPSRNRFQVSRVSESSSGVSSKTTSSPSPSSSSGSPTFFPPSRFRVVTVSEPSKKIEESNKMTDKCESKKDQSKEIDIPKTISSTSVFVAPTTFLNISNSSLLSSNSSEQLDHEIKRYIDMDSCSSFSSSIESESSLSIGE